MSQFRRWILFLFKIIKSNFGILQFPYKLIYVVTKECHSKCKNCLIWTQKPVGELTLNEVKSIAPQFSKISWLNLTGGEPTDRVDLVEIIQAFHQNCPELYLLNFPTNGLKPKKIEETCREILKLKIPKFVVNVSLDGPPDVNDQLRGISGDFVSAIETFQRLSKLKGIEVYFGMTLYPENSALIEKTLIEIKKHIPRFRKSQLHINLPHVSPHFYSNHQPIIKERWLSGVQKISDALKKFTRFPINFWNLTQIFEWRFRKLGQNYLATGRSPLACTAMTTSVYLSEKGVLHPCTIWNHPILDLRSNSESLIDKMKSPEWRNLALQVKKLDCPNCWSPCEAFQSLAANLLRKW